LIQNTEGEKIRPGENSTEQVQIGFWKKRGAAKTEVPSDKETHKRERLTAKTGKDASVLPSHASAKEGAREGGKPGC